MGNHVETVINHPAVRWLARMLAVLAALAMLAFVLSYDLLILGSYQTPWQIPASALTWLTTVVRLAAPVVLSPDSGSALKPYAAPAVALIPALAYTACFDVERGAGGKLRLKRLNACGNLVVWLLTVGLPLALLAVVISYFDGATDRVQNYVSEAWTAPLLIPILVWIVTAQFGLIRLLTALDTSAVAAPAGDS